MDGFALASVRSTSDDRHGILAFKVRIIWSRRQRMSFQPQGTCGDGRVDPGRTPPGCFVAAVMNFAVMYPAKRYCELIADLAAKRP